MGGRLERMLSSMQQFVEHIYHVETAPVCQFLTDENLSGEEFTAAVQIVKEDDELFLGVYIDNDIKERAEDDTLSYPNLMTLLEEVSHFTHLCYRATIEVPITPIELEALANVDKYIYSAKLIGKSICPSVLNYGQQDFIKDIIFVENADCKSEELNERYKVAHDISRRYARRIETLNEIELRRELVKLPRFPPHELKRYMTTS